MIPTPAEITPRTYYQRLSGVTSPALHEKRVLAVGCGAGSYLLEKLARFGPRTLHLIDFDRVEAANLVRSNYALRDLGCYKAEALADRIRAINPFIEVYAEAADICDVETASEQVLCNQADLIIAGTDHFPAQALLNRWSQKYSIPAVFVGIHEQALGGRIVWSLPGQTPCYRCTTPERYARFESAGSRETDLVGEQGSLVDGQFVDMIALKIALALLERGQNSTMGRFFNAMACRGNDVIVRMSPDYAYGSALWDVVLSDLPTAPKPYARELQEQVLFAMDTLWLPTEFLPNCPDCSLKLAENGDSTQ